LFENRQHAQLRHFFGAAIDHQKKYADIHARKSTAQILFPMQMKCKEADGVPSSCLPLQIVYTQRNEVSIKTTAKFAILLVCIFMSSILPNKEDHVRMGGGNVPF